MVFTIRDRQWHKHQKLPNKTMLIVGNSVLAGKNERWITQSKVKLKYLPGATTPEYVRPSNMEDHLKPLLKNHPIHHFKYRD